ncbi:hypothetical protein Tco_0812400 [Tanacetum coccineum]
MKSSRIIKKRKIQKSDDELKNFLKVVDFEGECAQGVELWINVSILTYYDGNNPKKVMRMWEKSGMNGNHKDGDLYESNGMAYTELEEWDYDT